MKKTSKILSLLLVFAMILPGVAQAATGEPVAEEKVVRLAGDTRVQTAIYASKLAYKDGSNTAIIAGYSGEVDALTGTLLANSKKAPILLNKKDWMSDGVEDELKRLGVKSIILLGGEEVLSKEVENKLKETYIVERVQGIDRAYTAANIAGKVKTKSDHVFLSRGYVELADALSIGPVSAMKNDPVLLTRPDRLPDGTVKALRDLKVEKVTIIGGKLSVSEDVVALLENMEIEIKERIAGDRREDTAAEIASKYFEDYDTALVAYGWKYADALVGGYVGAKINAPILLTNRFNLAKVTENFLKDNVSKAYVLGGKTVVSEEIFKEIEEAVNYDRNVVALEEAEKAVKEYESKVEDKDKVLKLVIDKDLAAEVSELFTPTVNKINILPESEEKTDLLSRMDTAHSKAVAAGTVNALQKATEDLTQDNLSQVKIKLSNAKTNVKNLADEEIKKALNELIEAEETKISAFEEKLDNQKADQARLEEEKNRILALIPSFDGEVDEEGNQTKAIPLAGRKLETTYVITDSKYGNLDKDIKVVGNPETFESFEKGKEATITYTLSLDKSDAEDVTFELKFLMKD